MQAVFLGAGASYECGLPRADELSQELRLWLTAERLEAYNQAWHEQGRGLSAAVVEQLQSLLADPGVDYEALLVALQGDLEDLSYQQRQRAQAFVLQCLYGLLLERQIKNYHYAKVALRDFRGLKQLAEQQRPLWVFTSNQDCLIELLAAELFIPLRSGLHEGSELTVGADPGSPGLPLEFEQLSAEQLAAGQWHFFAEGEYGINLVKLNGSLDLFALPNNQTANPGWDYRKLTSSSKTPDAYRDALLHLNTATQTLARHSNGLMANETLFLDAQGQQQCWYKTLAQGLQLGTERRCLPAQSPLLALLAEHLQPVQDLFVVGYGFGDQRINNILADWLTGASERQLRLVDPERSQVPTALAAAAQQVILGGKKLAAGEFFMRLAGDFGSLVQRLQRTMRAKARARLREKLLEQRPGKASKTAAKG